MQVMYNIKYGIYSFYVRQNLTVGFLRHCAQYCNYFIRQLSAATCCQFKVLTWPTVLTFNWRGEVRTESDERLSWHKMMLTALIYVWTCGVGGGTVNSVFIYKTRKCKCFVIE